MPFDTEDYKLRSKPVQYSDLDFEAFEREPLSPETLRSVQYMCDVEYHTVCYLRDMLVTPSHRDADVTTFMTMWNMEEFWHGAALAEVLKRHGIQADYGHIRFVRKRVGWKDKLDPIKHTLLANFAGQDYVAVHMAWGAVNEWSAIAAYNRLADIAGHSVLAQLLRRIAKQETRHVAFYATQARKRLAIGRKAQKLARFALERFWGPVGSGLMPEPEVRHVLRYVMRGEAGYAAARKVDESIARLPGMAGLKIVERSLIARDVPAT
ncbi:MAG: ferritin-like domain-containing protein [Streptosporangiales bacterium]|nr:ferritin-like domain-containing protein [Streptosporangiales bacterium]MBO0890622.1 ferritin-like domain-containing protein [Acidothermales bacterium]